MLTADRGSLAMTVRVLVDAWAGTATTGSPVGTGLSERARRLGYPDWAAFSAQRYGVISGTRRIIDVLGEEEVSATFFVSAIVAETWPELVREIAQAGHEIGAHGYSMDQEMASLGAEADREVIVTCGSLLASHAGQSPRGWLSPWGRRGEHTVANLAAEGYAYTCDVPEGDLPITVGTASGGSLLALPGSYELDDDYVIRRHGNQPGALAGYLRAAFEGKLAEQASGTDHDALCILTIHSDICGRPWGASVIAECVAVAREFGARLGTHDEIAQAW